MSLSLSPRWRARLTLIALGFIFAAPVTTAWFLYHYTNVGRGGASASHGDLLQPPRPLPDVALLDPVTGNRTAHLHGKWTLVYLAGPGCEAECREHLYVLRQLRLAMGQHADRVQRLLVIYRGWPPALDGQLLDAYPGQLLVDAAALDAGARGDAFRVNRGEDPVGAGRLYIIDPLGNLMMSYAAGTAPGGVIKDLQRLLRYSRIG